ncbi:hypothetical protein [Butyrivibrio fibrisolvens]|uniref:Uncharacterized protein n=1 Tax=Butyrivibrio fibrisolvens TaxID=831 RepID=A0A317G654_BUTFI|nr:hypothetical protein [Butyrivibrio fibrisolvens]PWT27970.1 hypothetical protein CPT75_13080 [Butyrivibrio fibrisolvens]
MFAIELIGFAIIVNFVVSLLCFIREERSAKEEKRDRKARFLIWLIISSTLLLTAISMVVLLMLLTIAIMRNM